MRVFLAVELPGELRDVLAARIRVLQERIQGRVSWVRPENLHITLRFLGETGKDQEAALIGAVEGICNSAEPCSLRLAGLTAVPHLRKAKLLWCGSAGGFDALAALQARCESASRALGFDPEKKSWKPHVTLARFRQPPDAEVLAKILDTHRDFEAGAFTVGAVSLFRSELKPHGAIYTRIRCFPFPPICSSEPSTTS